MCVFYKTLQFDRLSLLLVHSSDIPVVSVTLHGLPTTGTHVASVGLFLPRRLESAAKGVYGFVGAKTGRHIGTSG